MAGAKKSKSKQANGQTEVALLQKLLSQVHVGPVSTGNSRRRRRRRGRAKTLGSVPGSVPGSYPTATGSQGPVYSSSTSVGPTVRYRELVATGVVGANKTDVVFVVPVNPGKTGAKYLDQLGKIHDMYKFEHLSFVWLPSVGTSTNGSVVVSVDADASDTAPKTFAEVSGYQAQARSAVYQPVSTVVPAAFLKRLPWYQCVIETSNTDQICCNLLAALRVSPLAEEVTYGDLWIDYQVSFRGMRPGAT